MASSIRLTRKDIFFGCAATAFGALVVLSLVYLKGVSVGDDLDKSSKAYVDRVLPPIFASWSPDEFYKQVSPANRGKFKDKDVREMFKELSALGALRTYESYKGSAKPSHGPSGYSVNAVYQGTATFENGTLMFAVIVELRDGNWTIVGYQTAPPVFEKR